jgi:hypothetical protein
MILYHFTKPANLPGIAARGLIPSVPYLDWWTRGLPVVWLTRAESMKSTEADDLHWEMQRGFLLSDDEVERYKRHMVGSPDDVRLAVRLEPEQQTTRALWDMGSQAS